LQRAVVSRPLPPPSVAPRKGGSKYETSCLIFSLVLANLRVCVCVCVYEYEPKRWYVWLTIPRAELRDPLTNG
jgi:hypothetical protein